MVLKRSYWFETAVVNVLIKFISPICFYLIVYPPKVFNHNHSRYFLLTIMDQSYTLACPPAEVCGEAGRWSLVAGVACCASFI
jgi:hypothetical protein